MGTFAENLARLRRQHDMTQDELAKRVGITQAAIWQYEHGDATPKLAISLKLAEVFGTTVENLVRGE